jgi:CMP-N-acetylneuraminic acid synthetase
MSTDGRATAQTYADHCTLLQATQSLLEIVHIEGACMSWLVRITV